MTESDSANCEIHWDGVNINNWGNELNLFPRCRRESSPWVFQASRGLISQLVLRKCHILVCAYIGFGMLQ